MFSFVQVVISQNELKLLDSVEKRITLNQSNDTSSTEFRIPGWLYSSRHCASLTKSIKLDDSSNYRSLN